MNYQNALTGALVADAASLGLHWLYDQSRIATIADTNDILFREPNETDYKDCKGYFAHRLKHSGALSHYGEATLVAHRALIGTEAYSVSRHQQEFMNAFGPCGTFTGYADRPTKALIRVLLDETNTPESETGSDDDQLPALTSLPALFAWSEEQGITDVQALSEQLIRAVSMTTINDDALSGAKALMHCLKCVARGMPLTEALAESTIVAGEHLGALLNQALSLPEYDPLAAARTFGMPCHIPQGLPVIWHILKNAENFESAVRDNILCGGDSCGRAIAVGSVAGLVHGVPETLAHRADFTLSDPSPSVS